MVAGLENGVILRGPKKRKQGAQEDLGARLGADVRREGPEVQDQVRSEQGFEKDPKGQVIQSYFTVQEEKENRVYGAVDDAVRGTRLLPAGLAAQKAPTGPRARQRGARGLALGGSPRAPRLLVLVYECGTHTSNDPPEGPGVAGGARLRQDAAQPRQQHDPAGEHGSRRDGAFKGGGREYQEGGL